MAIALVACSGGREKSTTRYQPPAIPEVKCSIDPRRLGEVEKIRDFGNGRGCGVRNAWRVYSLQGVKMSQPVVLNCAMVNAFATWIANTMQPAAEDRFGEAVTSLDVPSAYACRPRNNVRGAKLSEHGHGNAVDVSVFRLQSGRKVEVEQGWFGSRKERRFLASVREDACGLFKTVLGPGSDRYHKNHLHFDLQRHRNGGSYCR
ncbi:MAG: extensin family protein [Proteobacteria bacterium]|nr:extensin family protein [Pseudomonadota bacterium]